MSCSVLGNRTYIMAKCLPSYDRQRVIMVAVTLFFKSLPVILKKLQGRVGWGWGLFVTMSGRGWSSLALPSFHLPRNFAAAQVCMAHYPLQQVLHSVSCRKFYSRNICQDPRRILPAAGELCVAKYSKDDKWYRARITSVREEELQVCFREGWDFCKIYSDTKQASKPRSSNINYCSEVETYEIPRTAVLRKETEH